MSDGPVNPTLRHPAECSRRERRTRQEHGFHQQPAHDVAVDVVRQLVREDHLDLVVV